MSNKTVIYCSLFTNCCLRKTFVCSYFLSSTSVCLLYRFDSLIISSSQNRRIHQNATRRHHQRLHEQWIDLYGKNAWSQTRRLLLLRASLASDALGILCSRRHDVQYQNTSVQVIMFVACFSIQYHQQFRKIPRL